MEFSAFSGSSFWADAPVLGYGHFPLIPPIQDFSGLTAPESLSVIQLDLLSPPPFQLVTHGLRQAWHRAQTQRGPDICSGGSRPGPTLTRSTYLTGAKYTPRSSPSQRMSGTSSFLLRTEPLQQSEGAARLRNQLLFSGLYRLIMRKRSTCPPLNG